MSAASGASSRTVRTDRVFVVFALPFIGSALDQERAFAYVAPAERAQLARPQAGVREDGDDRGSLRVERSPDALHSRRGKRSHLLAMLRARRCHQPIGWASPMRWAFWVEELRLVLVDAGHPALGDLDNQSFEMMLARIAWHEWGHALSVVRAEADDIADGERLLAFAPRGVMSSSPTSTRRRGETGKPPWLDGTADPA
jgi:hypothetical protein